ncbi:hypothetical protein ABZV61_32805 [Streptomyces sp900116325]|uniref:Uncharacterized protein n=1 Tax=Streptomyces sp. 900116325 TaxID=3154295 RepID=A0ABV2UHX2_9ACTN
MILPSRREATTVRQVEQRQVLEVYYSVEPSPLEFRFNTSLKSFYGVGLHSCSVDDRELREVPVPGSHSLDHRRTYGLGNLTFHAAHYLTIRLRLSTCFMLRSEKGLFERLQPFLESWFHNRKDGLE